MKKILTFLLLISLSAKSQTKSTLYLDYYVVLFITPLAKNVCMLTILNLKPGEIVNLLGISSSQVSNLRRDVNMALFNENTTRTLYQNLSRRYKILSS